MPKAPTQGVKWVDLKFGSYKIKALCASRVKGGKPWPEVVILQVPAGAKKKLEKGDALRDFLNEHDLLLKPTRKITHSYTLPGTVIIWIAILIHTKTCTSSLVWVPVRV